MGRGRGGVVGIQRGDLLQEQKTMVSDYADAARRSGLETPRPGCTLFGEMIACGASALIGIWEGWKGETV